MPFDIKSLYRKSRGHLWRWSLIVIGGLAVWAGLVMFLIPYNQMRLAQFRIDVLGALIRSYYLVEERKIESFDDFPDFHVVSHFDSLSLQKRDLAGGIVDGYIYDMQFLGGSKYVISASPVGKFAPQVEIAITNQGFLLMNNKDVDTSADSYDEVNGWEKVLRYDRPMTFVKS